jgi:hypothetical protein
MRFISNAEHGVEEDQPGVHPNILQRYYGVDDTESGSEISIQLDDVPNDSDDTDWESDVLDSDDNSIYSSPADSDLDEQIAADQQHDIRHDGVVPPHRNSPFTSGEAQDIFFAALNEIHAAGHVPEGYGVTPEELDDGYPLHESVRVASRDVMMELPLNIWYPRAVRWVQAYDLMLHMIDDQ